MTTPFRVPPALGFGNSSGGPVQLPPHVEAERVEQGRAARALTLFLPEQYMIPDGRGFNPQGSIATAAVQSNINITNATQVIPDNNLAVVSSVTIQITNMVATTNVTWTVLVNGAPVQGYNGISIFPRVAPFVGNTFDIPIRVCGPATIQVIFSNIDGGAYTVGAALSGWMWPVTSDQRWKAYGE